MPIRLIYKNFFIIQGLDLFIIILSIGLAQWMRVEGQPADIRMEMWQGIFYALPYVLAIKMVCFHWFGLYRGMWRYTSLVDVVNIAKAATISSLIIVSFILYFQRFEGYSRSVFVIDWALTVLMVSGLRLFLRFFYEYRSGGRTLKDIGKSIVSQFSTDFTDTKRILIIGAGDCGEKICREIRNNRQLSYQVVGFLDDHPVKVGKAIHGVPVLNSISKINIAAEKVQADQIIIAIPSATASQMRRIVEYCKESTLPFKTIPNIGEMIRHGQAISSIRDVAYRDLLGREVVTLDEDRVEKLLCRKTVMVTGAGGSIGSELCRQISNFSPTRLVLVERAETPLYEIERELIQFFPDIEIIPVLGDICDQDHLEKVFTDYPPEVVFHAAAYKHVPMLETQPWKAVDNNILGTMTVVRCAKKFNVSRFVFVSTDKAVRPTNVMGASKRVAEILIQNQNNGKQVGTRFMIVRFGNVVGSCGSVVPLFKKQIERGGPVTVTHPDVTRFFMTVSEACQLILQAGAMGNGGEIFLLDMGTPVKIDSMAKDLIRLSGLKPDIDIQVEYIGLRPGEKLYEELITDHEGVCATPHKKIMVLRGEPCNLNVLKGAIGQMATHAKIQDVEQIMRSLKSIVPEYRPSMALGNVTRIRLADPPRKMAGM